MKPLKTKMLHQITPYDCAPTAAMNAAIWAMKKRPRIIKIRDWRRVTAQSMHCTKDGTNDTCFDKVLRFMGGAHGFTVKPMIRINKRDRNTITDWIDDENHAVVLAHLDLGDEWHISLWFRENDRWLQGINVWVETGMGRYPVSQLRKYMERTDKEKTKTIA